MTRSVGVEHSAIGIRDATDADLPFVLSTLNPHILDSPYVYAEAPLTIEERRGWLATHRAAGLPILIAHDETGVAIGWASLSRYRESSGYRFTVEASVYVDPRFHRRGAASVLLASLEQHARFAGLHAIVASIDSENVGSIALFERHGYVEAARLPEVGRKFGRWRTQILLLKVLASDDG